MSDNATVLWMDSAGSAHSPLNRPELYSLQRARVQELRQYVVWTHISGSTGRSLVMLRGPSACCCASSFRRCHKPGLSKATD